VVQSTCSNSVTDEQNKYQLLNACCRFRHTLSESTATTTAPAAPALGSFNIATCFNRTMNPSSLLVQTDAGRLYSYSVDQGEKKSLEHQYDITPTKDEHVFKLVLPPVLDQVYQPLSPLDRRQFLPKNVDLTTNNQPPAVWKEDRFCFAFFDDPSDTSRTEATRTKPVNIIRASARRQQNPAVRPAVQQPIPMMSNSQVPQMRSKPLPQPQPQPPQAASQHEPVQQRYPEPDPVQQQPVDDLLSAEPVQQDNHADASYDDLQAEFLL